MSGWLRILIAGAGGQGVLSAGRWLGDATHACGIPVVVAQLHGLSQRGGSVQSSVAIGGARSPQIPDGMADVLVALEPMEGARVLGKVSERTTALVNTRPIVPASLQSTGKPYPDLKALLGPVGARAHRLVSLDATSLAIEAGSFRSLNVVMLGMLSGLGVLPFDGERLLDVILTAGLAAFGDVNRNAFRVGERAARDATRNDAEEVNAE